MPPSKRRPSVDATEPFLATPRNGETLPAPYLSPHRRISSLTVIAVLVASTVANLLLVLLLVHEKARNVTGPTTAYANLKRDVPSHFNTSSKFGLGTRSDIQRSINWESLDTSAGEIALDNTWAAQKGLPASTSFWWDQSQRSIYLVNGHHNLHCLRKLRRSIVLSRYNMTQMDSYPHLVHCMDHLLQNILCDADDTPLYTVPKHNSSTGHGQPRQCRSWDKLQAWAESQTSCFSYINETQGVDAILQRFRYCPDSDPGHRYDAAMRAHFNLGPDWDGTPRRDIDTIPQYWKNFPE